MYALVRCDRAGRRCARCHEPLVESAVVVQNLVGWDDPENPHLRFHPRCALDVSAYYARLALEHTHLDFAERAPLLALAESRWEAIEAARVTGAPRPVVERATDPWGRPRVTVLIAGSAMGDRDWVRFSKAVPLFTWRSELREYVFDRVVKKRLVLDPSQPIVGGVFAANAGGRVVRSHLDHLATWHALGTPAPLVWTFGATTEAQSAYLREGVASVGWAPSEVPWLQGPAAGDFGADALHALVSALDAALPDAAGLGTATADADPRPSHRPGAAIP